MSEDEQNVCVHCGGTPCKWDEFGPELLRREEEMHNRQRIDGDIVVVNDLGSQIENKEMRKSMYRIFTYLKYGYLGHRVRIPIPQCVVLRIQDQYPDVNGDYMGFKDAQATEGVYYYTDDQLSSSQRNDQDD